MNSIRQAWFVRYDSSLSRPGMLLSSLRYGLPLYFPKGTHRLQVALPQQQDDKLSPGSQNIKSLAKRGYRGRSILSLKAYIRKKSLIGTTLRTFFYFLAEGAPYLTGI